MQLGAGERPGDAWLMAGAGAAIVLGLANSGLNPGIHFAFPITNPQFFLLFPLLGPLCYNAAGWFFERVLATCQVSFCRCKSRIAFPTFVGRKRVGLFPIIDPERKTMGHCPIFKIGASYGQEVICGEPELRRR